MIQNLRCSLLLNIFVTLSMYRESEKEVPHSFSHLPKQDLLSIYDNISSIPKCIRLQNNSLLFYVWIREEKPSPIKLEHAISC